VSRENQCIIYLDDAEYQQLQEWADTTGKSMSELGRDAILEYTDQDRLERIEDKIDTLLTQSKTDTSHTHKNSNTMQKGSETVEKARQIVRRIQANHGDVLKSDAVDRAIEDIAGVDERTIRKYKRLFRKRGILFEHPGEPPLWTSDANQWLTWMQDYTQLNGRDEAERIVSDYPARVTMGTDETLNIELTDENNL